eukprot:scaffold660537_cov59-Prasinocladus_malaysianus.AAC.1
MSIGARLPFDATLESGQDGLRVVPADRWGIDNPMEAAGPFPSAVRFGGFLYGDVSACDASGFSLSGSECSMMDPQQRFLLETSWSSLHPCEPSSEGLTNWQDIGVYVGIWIADYIMELTGLQANLNPYSATGCTSSVAAGRVSFTFGLKGPCIAMDTACSASLVSAHLGALALARGECTDASLASGVNLLLIPQTYQVLGAASMLSPSGRCKALDGDADGYARGEAAISFLLQLMAASRTEDTCVPMAVFAGSAVNQDGRSSALTTPNGPSQQGAITK